MGGLKSTPITNVKTAIVTLLVDRQQIAHEADYSAQWCLVKAFSTRPTQRPW